jgi:hypothetical protein
VQFELFLVGFFHAIFVFSGTPPSTSSGTAFPGRGALSLSKGRAWSEHKNNLKRIAQKKLKLHSLGLGVVIKIMIIKVTLHFNFRSKNDRTISDKAL